MLRWVAIASIVSAASTASADTRDLERARAELETLDFGAARGSLERALESGLDDPAEVREALAMSARVAVVLDDTTAADTFFRRLLSLDPSATLAPGLAPKIVESFERARAWLTGVGPLRARLETSRAQAPSVALVVTSDPLGLVTSARVRYLESGRERALVLQGRSRLEAALPIRGPTEVTVTALDEHGNALMELRAVVTPVARAASRARRNAPPSPEPARSGTPLYAAWWLYGAIAVAAGAAGGILAWRAVETRAEIDALNRESSSHDYSEASRLDDRGRRESLIADVCLGVAGAAAITSALVLFAGDDGESDGDGSAEPASSRARVAPYFAERGAGISAHGAF